MKTRDETPQNTSKGKGCVRGTPTARITLQGPFFMPIWLGWQVSKHVLMPGAQLDIRHSRDQGWLAGCISIRGWYLHPCASLASFTHSTSIPFEFLPLGWLSFFSCGIMSNWHPFTPRLSNWNTCFARQLNWDLIREGLYHQPSLSLSLSLSRTGSSFRWFLNYDNCLAMEKRKQT